MNAFIKWYFPIKLLLTVIFLFTKSYASPIFMWFVFIDLIAIPLLITIINLIKKKKLRSGEYRVKPEGRRL